MKPVFDLLSPAAAEARLQIFIFHRVHARADPLMPGEMHAQRFEQVCHWLRTWFNVLPLDAAVHRLRDRSLPARAAAITFDDGYADNHDVALPILQRHGLAATFFIATGFLDGGRMWNDTVIESVRGCRADALDLRAMGLPGPASFPLRDVGQRQHCIAQLLGHLKYLPGPARVAATERIAALAGADLPGGLMLSTAQLRALAATGMGIGAHTVSHPILADMAADEARQEIAQGRGMLQDLLQAPVTLFAYPNGKPGVDYSAHTVGIVRDLGFAAAVSTAWGAAHAASDPYQLPRFTPWDRSRLRFGARLARNLLGRHTRSATLSPAN